MTNAQQSFDVFLSYNSQDKTEVKEIAEKLKARDLNVWLDEEQILPGQSFQDAIQKAIPLVKVATIFVSSKGLGPWQLLEQELILKLCVQKKIRVIPVLLPGVSKLPEELSFFESFRWIRFSQRIDEEDVLDSLV